MFIVIFAGALAGLIHGFVNIVVVEPYLDAAIGIENRHLFMSGEAQDTPQFWSEFNDYRIWQKDGSVLAGVLLGASTGALFGLVFAYSRRTLPGRDDFQRALVLGGIMWATIFFIPFLKYPANPPTVGDPNTIVFRATMYALFIAISGLGALGFSRVYKKMQSKKYLAFFGYAAFMGFAFAIMPPNPDEITAPMDLVNGFRAISAITMTIYWIANSVILGLLWKKAQPHAESKQILE